MMPEGKHRDESDRLRTQTDNEKRVHARLHSPTPAANMLPGPPSPVWFLSLAAHYTVTRGMRQQVVRSRLDHKVVRE
ncbi:MAG: hypothetical protein ACYDDO_05505 [Acidiferrobacterales bacterium]